MVYNPCEHGACKNNATCTFTGPGEHICDCHDGSRGTNCELERVNVSMDVTLEGDCASNGAGFIDSLQQHYSNRTEAYIMFGIIDEIFFRSQMPLSSNSSHVTFGVIFYTSREDDDYSFRENTTVAAAVDASLLTIFKKFQPPEGTFCLPEFSSPRGVLVCKGITTSDVRGYLPSDRCTGTIECPYAREDETGCDPHERYNLTVSSQQNITSPGYPSSYMHRVFRTFTVDAPEGYVVEFSFDPRDIRLRRDDWIEMGEFNDMDEVETFRWRLDNFSLPSPPRINTLSRRVYIVFASLGWQEDPPTQGAYRFQLQATAKRVDVKHVDVPPNGSVVIDVPSDSPGSYEKDIVTALTLSTANGFTLIVCIDFTTTHIDDGDDAMLGVTNRISRANVLAEYDRDQAQNPNPISNSMFMLLDADDDDPDPGRNYRFSSRVYSVNLTVEDLYDYVCPARFDGACEPGPCNNGFFTANGQTSPFIVNRCEKTSEVCRDAPDRHISLMPGVPHSFQREKYPLGDYLFTTLSANEGSYVEVVFNQNGMTRLRPGDSGVIGAGHAVDSERVFLVISQATTSRIPSRMNTFERDVFFLFTSSHDGDPNIPTFFHLEFKAKPYQVVNVFVDPGNSTIVEIPGSGVGESYAMNSTFLITANTTTEYQLVLCVDFSTTNIDVNDVAIVSNSSRASLLSHLGVFSDETQNPVSVRSRAMSLSLDTDDNNTNASDVYRFSGLVHSLPRNYTDFSLVCRDLPNPVEMSVNITIEAHVRGECAVNVSVFAEMLRGQFFGQSLGFTEYGIVSQVIVMNETRVNSSAVFISLTFPFDVYRAALTVLLSHRRRVDVDIEALILTALRQLKPPKDMSPCSMDFRSPRGLEICKHDGTLSSGYLPAALCSGIIECRPYFDDERGCAPAEHLNLTGNGFQDIRSRHYPNPYDSNQYQLFTVEVSSGFVVNFNLNHSLINLGSGDSIEIGEGFSPDDPSVLINLRYTQDSSAVSRLPQRIRTLRRRAYFRFTSAVQRQSDNETNMRFIVRVRAIPINQSHLGVQPNNYINVNFPPDQTSSYARNTVSALTLRTDPNFLLVLCIDFNQTKLKEGDRALLGYSNQILSSNIIAEFNNSLTNPLVLNASIFVLLDTDDVESSPDQIYRFSGRIFSVNSSGKFDQICPARFNGNCSANPCQHHIVDGYHGYDGSVRLNVSRCFSDLSVCREFPDSHIMLDREVPPTDLLSLQFPSSYPRDAYQYVTIEAPDGFFVELLLDADDINLRPGDLLIAGYGRDVDSDRVFLAVNSTSVRSGPARLNSLSQKVFVLFIADSAGEYEPTQDYRFRVHVVAKGVNSMHYDLSPNSSQVVSIPFGAGSYELDQTYVITGATDEGFSMVLCIDFNRTNIDLNDLAVIGYSKQTSLLFLQGVYSQISSNPFVIPLNEFFIALDTDKVDPDPTVEYQFSGMVFSVALEVLFSDDITTLCEDRVLLP